MEIMEKRFYCGFFGKERAFHGKQAQNWVLEIIPVGSEAEKLFLIVSYQALERLRKGTSGQMCESPVRETTGCGVNRLFKNGN